MKSSDVLSKWSLRARETSYKEAVRRFLVIKGYVGLKTMMSHILEFFCQSKYATNCKEKLSLSKKMEPLHSGLDYVASKYKNHSKINLLTFPSAYNSQQDL